MVSLLTGLTVSVSIKVEWGLWTGLLPGPSVTTVGTRHSEILCDAEGEPRASYMLSARPPTEVALVLIFSFQCDQKVCPASDFCVEILVFSLEEGLRLRSQRKLISLSFKETLSVKL